MKIKEVKYTYTDREYGMEYMEFDAELEVKSTDYDLIVEAIQRKHPDYREIKIMSSTGA